jgi:hypothetical protein
MKPLQIVARDAETAASRSAKLETARQIWVVSQFEK